MEEKEETSKEEYMEEEVEPIYKGDLSLEDIQENPVLQPIMEINKKFIETQKIINNYVWSWEKDKETINSYTESEPIYSQTFLMAKIQSLIGSITHAKFLQESQQELLKRAIQDMIKISKQQVEELRELSEENEEIIKQLEDKNKEEEPREEQEEKAE